MKRFYLCAAVFAVAIGSNAADATHEVRLDGRLHVAETTSSATLRVFCTPVADGAVGLELIVPDAETRKDFDYDDFEGPDAAASKRALSRVNISGESGKTEIARTAAGSYGVEPAGSFVFSVSQVAWKSDSVANLLATLDGQRGHIVWVQTAFDDSKRELRGAFDFDDAMAKRLRDVVAPCLARKSNP
jgi:hypothetical protein